MFFFFHLTNMAHIICKTNNNKYTFQKYIKKEKKYFKLY